MGKIVKSTDKKGQVIYPVTLDDAVVCTDEIGKKTLKQKLISVGANVIAVKEYKEFIAASNASGNANAKYCFLKVKPTDFNKPLTIRYRITVTPAESATNANKHLINGTFDIELAITRTGILYNTFNKFASTTYFPIRYCVQYYLSTEAGINAGASHLLGIYTYNGYQPTDATLKRDLKVEVLYIDGGTYELLDTIDTFAKTDGYSATYHTTTSQVSSVIGAYHSGDQNTTYTLNYLYDNGVNKSGVGAYALSRYDLVMQNENFGWERLVDTSKTYSTATTKTVNTHGFRLGCIRYYNSTTVCANGANIATNTLAVQYTTLDLRYSTNCGTPADWVAGQYIYIVGTIGDDGLFYLDTTKWWSNALPTEEDGKIYMKLGTVITSASYSSSLSLEHPCYRYVNGTIERYFQGLDEKQDVIEDIDTIRSGAKKGATALQEHQDISGLLSKDEADAEYQPKGDYLTEHQDISYLARKTEIPVVPTKISAFENDLNFVEDAPRDNLPRVRQGGSWVVQQPAEVIYNSTGNETIISVTDSIYNDYF